MVLPTILVDGFVAGTWKVTCAGKTAVLTVSPFAGLSPATRAELAAEGETLARFSEPDATGFDVRFEG
jgi:hypothetical protein